MIQYTQEQAAFYGFRPSCMELRDVRNNWIPGESNLRTLNERVPVDGSTVIATQTRFVGDYRLDAQGTFFGISSPDLPITKYELVYNSADGWDERYLSAIRYAVADQDPLKVVCSPSLVDRGGNVSCAATENGQPVQASSWTFTSTDPSFSFSYSEPGTRASWGGQVAAPGVVSASYNGKTASGSFDIQARIWDDTHFTYDVQYKGNGPYGRYLQDYLVDPPLTFGGLGDTKSWLVPKSNYLSFIKKIDGGPNNGVWFVLDNPFIARLDIANNEAAMKSTSEWSKLQPDNRNTSVTPNTCSKTDVTVTLPPLIRLHEGVTPWQQSYQWSHVMTFKSAYVGFMHMQVEKVLSTQLPDLKKEQLISEQYAATASNSLTHSLSLNPINSSSLPCRFNF